MNQKYLFLFFVVQLLCFTTITAQNIAINDNGSSPDSTAMLDISSSTKGFLIPRMTAAQRNLIPSPAQGLLIYSTTDSSFYYFSNGWNRIGRSNEGWGLNGNAGTDENIHFIGTTDAKALHFKVNNYNAGSLDAPKNNAAFGTGSLDSVTTGNNNTATGAFAGKAIKTGNGNTFIGSGADALSAGLINATAIGTNAKVGLDNSMVLGKAATKIGIGTSIPGSTGINSIRLEIADEDGSNSDVQMRVASGGFPIVNLLGSNGSLSAPTNFAGNRPTGVIQSGYYSGTGYGNGAGIIFSSGDSPAGFSPGKITLYTRANNSATITNTLLMNENGNVGIGMLTPTAQLQLGNLVQNRKIVLWDNTGNDNQFYGWGINAGILRYQTETTSSDHVFYAGASAATSNELVRIKGNGKLGIGQSNPYTRFSNIDSNILGSDGIGMAGLSMSWAMSTQGYVQGFYNGQTGFGRNGLTVKIAGTANNNSILDLSTGPFIGGVANSVMIVRGNGNVGINNISPSQKLDIKGNIALNDSSIFLRAGSNGNHYLKYGSDVDGPTLNGNSGGALSTVNGNVLYWKSTNKIGILTNNPVSQFANIDSNIVGANGYGLGGGSTAWAMNQQGFVQGLYNRSTTGGSNGLVVKIAGTGAANTLLDLSTGGSITAPGNSVMVVRGNGNVSIGTATANEKLTVNGALKIADGGYLSIINNDFSPVPAGGAGTMVFSNNHFFGWNGSQWKQLDN